MLLDNEHETYEEFGREIASLVDLVEEKEREKLNLLTRLDRLGGYIPELHPEPSFEVRTL